MSKVTFMGIVILLTCTGVILASNVKSQNLEATKITIKAKSLFLRDVLLSIEKKTGFTFVYAEKIGSIPAVTISDKSDNLYLVLKEIAKNHQLRFNQIGYMIAVEKAPAPVKPASLKQDYITLTGTVRDAKTGETLIGVSVLVKNSKTGTTTNTDGQFTLKVPEGSGVLQLYYIGFKPVEVAFSKAQPTFDIKMEQDNNALSEVMISAVRKSMQPVKHTDEREVLEEIKSSESIISGISSVEIGKLADINAAQVSKRISGVTVSDEQFLIVRGMNQRYNATYLGDNVAPSTEQYSRAFALNLIPSRIIDKILVYKSPSPELFGDFAGAVVKIVTKDALAIKHFDVGLRLGYLPVSTFKDINTYKGSSTDWLGFDNGSRKLPAAVSAYGDFRTTSLTNEQYIKAFSPTLTYNQKTALPDAQLTLNYYDVFKIGGKNLYNVTNFAYTNETRNNDTYRQQGNTLLTQNFNYNNNISNEIKSTETAQLNLLQNFTFKLNNSNQFYFKNFITQEGKKTTQVRVTMPNNGLEFQDRLLKNNILAFSSRLLYAGNVGGYHLLNKAQSLNWNLGYTSTNYQLPDMRVVNLATSEKYFGKDEDPDLRWAAAVRRQGNTNDRQTGIITRLFLKNTEKLYNGSADYTYNILKGLDIKAGTYHFWKERVLNKKIFVVQDGLFTSANDFNNSSTVPGIDGYVNPELLWFREQDLKNVWNQKYFPEDKTGLGVYDITKPSDSYLATEQYNSGYASIIAKPWNGLVTINGGARLEYDRQKVAASIDQESFILPLLVDRPKTVLLPSVNVSLRPDSGSVLRFGYGRTVNRPEFREITPFTDLDYLNNEYVGGNVNLTTAVIDNFDLRYEFYPQKNKGETYSIGAFYKSLNKPIERIVYSSLVGEAIFPSVGFANADNAKVYGVEAEVRKSLSFIPGGFFRTLSVVANGAWVYSRSTKREADNTYPFPFKRQLQGQSPYIINTSLFYDNEKSGTRASVSLNVTGTSIYAAGIYTESVYGPSGSRGSVFQLTRQLLDASVSQTFAKRWQAKLSAQNILNKPLVFAEDSDFNNKYNAEKVVESATDNGTKYKTYVGDNIYSKYNPGRYFLLSFIYSF